MNTFNKSIALMALVAFGAFGQLTTTSTTLSTTVTSNSTAQWCIASATGVVLPSLSGATSGSYFVIDKEAAQVQSQGSSSTCYNVKRGQLGTSASVSHLAGDTLWVGGAAASSGDTSRPFTGAIINYPPSGYCVAALQYTLPVILVTTSTNPNAGALYSCIDQHWTNVSALSQLTITGQSQVPAATGGAAAAALTVTGGAGAATTTTTGTGGAGGANVITAGVGGLGGSSSGAAGAGGANTAISGAGGAGPVTGGTGGAATLGAGAGGAGSGAGGTGGALALYSGAAGAGGTGTSGAIAIKTGGAAGTSAFAVSTAGATSVVSAGTNQSTTISPSGSGTVNFTGGTDPTKVVKVDASSATTGTATTLAAAQAGNITVGLPIQAGALPTAYFCGATSGSTTCANTATGGTARVFGGIATLSSNSAVLTGISPAFTSTSTYTCVANDLTTRANPVQVANTSSSSITITNTTGASDVINYICVGY